MPVVFDALRTLLAPRVRRLTFLIALGTHPPMTEGQLDDHLGAGWRTGSGVAVEQHDWKGSDVPRTVLAHSTHVKGIGTFVDGVERPRIEVVLATGIREAVCREIHLGYKDPDSFDVEESADREDEGILVVPNAGEMLYRLSDGSVPDVDAL